MKLFWSKSNEETERLLMKFNQNVIETHAKAAKLARLMQGIKSGECPLFPCYVDREGILSLKRNTKVANGQY